MKDSKEIDMSEALRLLTEAVELCETLHGEPTNIEKPNDKALQSRNAKRSRELQYAAHVVDAARVAISTQFHRFKGDMP